MFYLQQVGKPDCREETMVKSTDDKIKDSVKYLIESLDAINNMRKENPETQLQDLEVRGWLLAARVTAENLSVLLKDIQPQLPLG